MRNAEIVAQYDSGKSPTALAVRFGLTATAVRLILRGVGRILTTGDALEAKKERNVKLVSAYVSGEPVERLSKKYQLRNETIRHILRAAGQRSKRGRPPTTSLLRDTVVAMQEKGMTYQQIANQFNVSRQRIQQVLRLSGVSTGSPKSSPH